MDAPPAPQLVPMLEADLEEAARLEIWGNPVSDTQKVLLGRDRTPEGLAKVTERHRKSFHDRKTTFLKVVDPATGDIMAWAAWYLFPVQTEEEMVVESPDWTLPQWFTPFLKYRYEVLKGRPHYYLGMIVTSPDYRRRGAASLLLKWGIDKADEAGVEMYIESSVAGRPLYEKYGLRMLKVMEYDMAQLGYEGTDIHFCMWRPVRGQDT